MIGLFLLAALVQELATWWRTKNPRVFYLLRLSYLAVCEQRRIRQVRSFRYRWLQKPLSSFADLPTNSKDVGCKDVDESPDSDAKVGSDLPPNFLGKQIALISRDPKYLRGDQRKIATYQFVYL